MAHVVLMGVAGCGKTTVGRMAADLLRLPFTDGDDLHSPESIAKMASGRPLTDDDRWPWLDRVGEWLAAQPEGGVVACSALKRSYRERLRRYAPDAFFFHLAAPKWVLQSRLESRAGHFMSPAMLDSQLAIVEPLAADERGTVLDVHFLSPKRAAQAVVYYTTR